MSIVPSLLSEYCLHQGADGVTSRERPEVPAVELGNDEVATHRSEQLFKRLFRSGNCDMTHNSSSLNDRNMETKALSWSSSIAGLWGWEDWVWGKGNSAHAESGREPYYCAKVWIPNSLSLFTKKKFLDQVRMSVKLFSVPGGTMGKFLSGWALKKYRTWGRA